jgi:hypothetical protein
VPKPKIRSRATRTVGCTAAVWAAPVAFALCVGACGHAPAPSAAAPPPSPAGPVDPAPGAQPGERNHLLEASWKEVRVKARKQGTEVVSAIKLVAPQVRIFHAAPPPAPESEPAKPNNTPPADAKSPEELIDLAQTFRKITPLEVDHLDILDGQVAFVDVSRAERPELWLHDLELSVENLTTRVRSGEGRPVLLTASGMLANSGHVSIFVTANPFEKGLTFSGRAAIVGLQTAELYRFIAPATKLQAPEGTVDIFVEFDCRNGELTGGVKPVLKNVVIRPQGKNPFTVLKAWVADLAIKIFRDDDPRRNAVATVLPIKGTITGPDVQLWPAIFGVMRNAFVEGLASGYAHVPPVTAPQRESVVAQGVQALSGSQPPKAQPTSPSDPAPSAETKPDHERGAETGIPVAATPQGLMRDGAEAHIQERLRARGFLQAGQSTGVLDADTRAALRTFQKSEGLPATSLPSYETIDHLGLSLDAIFHSTPRPRDPTAAAGDARALTGPEAR